MEIIKIYRAIDGLEFSNQQDCVNHERELEEAEINKVNKKMKDFIFTNRETFALVLSAMKSYCKNQEYCEHCLIRNICSDTPDGINMDAFYDLVEDIKKERADNNG